MPTPYGSRGGMAFSAEELRVLQRALALVLQPATAVPSAAPGPRATAPHPRAAASHSSTGPSTPGQRGAPASASASTPAPTAATARADEVWAFLRLAQAVDEAAREGGRLRAFVLDELARYRAALPGAATSYLEQLRGALTAGYAPSADDLTALRALCADPVSRAESERRCALLRRCERLAQRGVLARPIAFPGSRSASRPAAGPPPDKSPGRAPAKAPGPVRQPPGDAEPSGPRRPVPTPGEAFPPKRPSSPPPPSPSPSSTPSTPSTPASPADERLATPPTIRSA
ncbi:hypothetical protein [Streptomyces zagrosensis]|uniref:Uncharacterized protein n=1 Tax=Streptomyces zagrosensis TaxID=1042984 RepID=A0A7W9V1L0_9ACTN|nr:hypothetical protein [Streptomyces zagrosensis]MBB5939408.1 hypothetical protein [Streptomyces zagrosensis]